MFGRGMRDYKTNDGILFHLGNSDDETALLDAISKYPTRPFKDGPEVLMAIKEDLKDLNSQKAKKIMSAEGVAW